MRAILVDESTRDMSIGEVADPVPRDHELLVRVKATAVNRADLLQRYGKYPPPPGASPIIGLEMAGVVEKVGSGIIDWQIGDRVCALLPGGGYAEKAVIPAEMAIPIPDNLSYEEAAAVPEVFLTAYLNLFMLGHMKAGEFVLIHAGASGVGTAAIQLVREAGAIPIATAGSDTKLQACRTLGAQHVVNYRGESIASRVQEYTAGRGVSLILDPVGASYWEANTEGIAVDGRWVIIGGLGGQVIDRFNFQVFMQKRIQLIFSTLRSRSEEDKIELTKQFLAFAQERLATGALQPIIDKVYDWSDVMEAHEHMKQNRNIGKIVLTVS